MKKYDILLITLCCFIFLGVILDPNCENFISKLYVLIMPILLIHRMFFLKNN